MKRDKTLKEALLYEKLESGRVHCLLCNHHCRIPDEGFGICQVRENRGGVLYTHSYGELIAQNIDPIEKKPLYHFIPGSRSFSVAAVGCNFQCGFCQNWQISQVKEAKRLRLKSEFVGPEVVAEDAKRSGAESVSYTYTEPTIFFEYAFEISQRAKKDGLYNVWVTNGFMTADMIQMIRPYLDAANIDLKSFDDAYYRRTCKAALAPVLKNIELMNRLGIWIEVTTLLVPGQNDSDDELREIARFLAGVSPAIPWHVSRFYPQFKMDRLEPTPVSVLNRAYDIGKEAGLRYVYLGNVEGRGNTTFCHQCDTALIERKGFSVEGYRIKEGKCPHCGTQIDGKGL
jgi:pyruvate formate lyase activating enzyme